MIHSTLFCELSFHFEPNIKLNKIWQNFRKTHFEVCIKGKEIKIKNIRSFYGKIEISGGKRCMGERNLHSKEEGKKKSN
jgi:hypothetical protein